MVICCAPAERPVLSLPPRRRFSNAIAPVASLSMRNRPIRVSRIISGADIQQIMASQCSRRSDKAHRTDSMCDSRNSMVTITMSPSAMAARVLSSAVGSRSHSVAAWDDTCSAGTCFESPSAARDQAPLTWLSSVTSTTRRGWLLSATEVRFRFIQRLDINHGEALLLSKVLGISSRLAAHEEGNLS